MDARHLLEGMAARGFAVSLEGEHLAVSPKSGLTPKLRDALKAHKSELVALLAHGNPFAQPDVPPLEDAPPDARPQPKAQPLDENRNRLNRLESLLGSENAAGAIYAATQHIKARNPDFFRQLKRESRHELAICAALLDNGLEPDETRSEGETLR
jgi:hypothetical protein